MSDIKKGVRPVRKLSDEHVKRIRASDALRAANPNVMGKPLPPAEEERQPIEEEDDVS